MWSFAECQSSKPHLQNSQLKLKTQLNLNIQLKAQLTTRHHVRFYVVPKCNCLTNVFLYVLFVCFAIVSKLNSKLNSTIKIQFRTQLRTQSSNQFIHTLFSSCTCLRWAEGSTTASVVRSPTCNAHSELIYFACDAHSMYIRWVLMPFCKPRLPCASIA